MSNVPKNHPTHAAGRKGFAVEPPERTGVDMIGDLLIGDKPPPAQSDAVRERRERLERAYSAGVDHARLRAEQQRGCRIGPGAWRRSRGRR